MTSAAHVETERIFQHELEQFITTFNYTKKCQVKMNFWEIWSPEHKHFCPARCMARKYDLYDTGHANINRQCPNKAVLGDFCRQCLNRKIWLGRVDIPPVERVIKLYQRHIQKCTDTSTRHVISEVDTSNFKKFWSPRPRSTRVNHTSKAEKLIKNSPSTTMQSTPEYVEHYVLHYKYPQNPTLFQREIISIQALKRKSHFNHSDLHKRVRRSSPTPMAVGNMELELPIRTHANMTDFPTTIDEQLNSEIYTDMQTLQFSLHQILDHVWPNQNEFKKWFDDDNHEHTLLLQDELNFNKWTFGILDEKYIIDQNKMVVGFCRHWMDETNIIPQSKKTDDGIVLHDDTRCPIREYLLFGCDDQEEEEELLGDEADMSMCHGLRAGVYREFKYDPEYNVFQNHCLCMYENEEDNFEYMAIYMGGLDEVDVQESSR